MRLFFCLAVSLIGFKDIPRSTLRFLIDTANIFPQNAYSNQLNAAQKKNDA